MVGTQVAPVPSRRNRGGLPARCSAIFLGCAFVLAPAAQGASEPTPDPVQHAQPDPAPVKKTQTSRKQPTVQAPAQPVLVPTPVRTPVPIVQALAEPHPDS